MVGVFGKDEEVIEIFQTQIEINSYEVDVDAEEVKEG